MRQSKNTLYDKLTENRSESKTKVEVSCPLCGKVLSMSDKLTQHIKTVHSEAKLVKKCEVRILNQKENIDPEQLKLVTKPFKGKECPYCKAVLSRSDKLTYHMRSKHSKQYSKWRNKKPSHVGVKSRQKVSPWELLWNSKEPVYVKFNFKKRFVRRERSDSEISVDLTTENVTLPYTQSSSPAIEKLLMPPKPKTPPKSNIRILQAIKYK